MLRGTRDGIAYNTHYAADGVTVYKHACALGCEGIMSKQLGSPYRSGRVNHWLQIKNPASPAARREAVRPRPIRTTPHRAQEEPSWRMVEGRGDCVHRHDQPSATGVAESKSSTR